MVKRARGWFGRRFKIWLRSMVAAAISGGAHALAGGGVISWIAPETFNFSDGAAKLVQATVGLAVAGAVTGVAGYLVKSPLPDAPQDPKRVEELRP